MNFNDILPKGFYNRLGLKKEKFFYKTVYFRCGFETPSFKKQYQLENGLVIKNNRRFIKFRIKKDKVVSFDTETYMGKCRLIALSESNKEYSSYLIRDDNENDYDFFIKCLDFLMYKSSNSKFYRFFYNIDFDFSAILKLLDDLVLSDYLVKGIEVSIDKFRIKWFKGRLLILKKGNKTCYFTDLFNFFKTKLNIASKIFLDDIKLLKDNIDGNLLNTSLDYWNERENDIIKYCIQDCYICSHLGKKIIESINQCGIELPKYLVSSASLSKRDFRYNCFIPSIEFIPQKIMEIAYKTYFGGRFEMLKSGYFEKLYLYDINSQYPTFIKNLPNLKYGAWKRFENLKELPKIQVFGFFYVKMYIPENIKLSTIPVMYKQTIKFPTGFIEKWCTWFDLDLMRKYIIEIKDSYIWIQDKNTKKVYRQFKPFRKRVNHLFKLKALYKKSKNSVMYMIVKLTLNSLYGCFIEQHKNYELDGSFSLSSGVLFNSVYASQITAFGRWSVIREIPSSLWKNIIAIHTDSIITDIPFDFLKCNDKMGAWNLETKGKGIVVNTGMYQIGYIVKTRGIPKFYIKNWLRFCLKYQNLYLVKFQIKRMRKISQAIIQDKHLDNVNVMLDVERTVALNNDKKRTWFEKYYNFKDLMSKNIDSLPLISIINNNDVEIFPNHLVY